MRKMSKIHMPNSFFRILHFSVYLCKLCQSTHASIILCLKLNVAFVNAQPGKCLISCHAHTSLIVSCDYLSKSRFLQRISAVPADDENILLFLILQTLLQLTVRDYTIPMA